MVIFFDQKLNILYYLYYLIMEVQNNDQNYEIIYPTMLRKYTGHIETKYKKCKTKDPSISYYIIIKSHKKYFKVYEDAVSYFKQYNINNDYEIRNIIYKYEDRLEVSLSQDKLMICDLDQENFIQSHIISLSLKNISSKYPSQYASIHINSKNYSFHKVILDPNNEHNDYVIDHIDGNGLNNMKNNLRITTHKINSINRRTRLYNELEGIFKHKTRYSAKYRDEYGFNIVKMFPFKEYNSESDALDAALKWRKSNLLFQPSYCEALFLPFNKDDYETHQSEINDIKSMSIYDTIIRNYKNQCIDYGLIYPNQMECYDGYVTEWKGKFGAINVNIDPVISALFDTKDEAEVFIKKCNIYFNILIRNMIHIYEDRLELYITSCDMWAKFDLDMIDKLSKYTAYYLDGKNRLVYKSKRKSIYHIIFDESYRPFPKVKYINNDYLDLRKQNLKLITKKRIK